MSTSLSARGWQLAARLVCACTAATVVGTVAATVATTDAAELRRPQAALAEPLRVTYEILPAPGATTLPPTVADVEGVRFELEELTIEETRYWKAAYLLPLPAGTTRRERVIFLAHEETGLRMLGFHEIFRRNETPEGETFVFESGRPNPMKGTVILAPHDTYTLLGLATGLLGDLEASMDVHLWMGSEVVHAQLSLGTTEAIEALGSTQVAKRIELRVEPRGDQAAPLAVFWLDERAPHTLLRYEGPTPFAAGGEVARGQVAGAVTLRATSSSEQIRALFSSAEPPPR